jgi:hypothetical protein
VIGGVHDVSPIFDVSFSLPKPRFAIYRPTGEVIGTSFEHDLKKRDTQMLELRLSLLFLEMSRKRLAQNAFYEGIDISTISFRDPPYHQLLRCGLIYE